VNAYLEVAVTEMGILNGEEQEIAFPQEIETLISADVEILTVDSQGFERKRVIAHTTPPIGPLPQYENESDAPS